MHKIGNNGINANLVLPCICIAIFFFFTRLGLENGFEGMYFKVAFFIGLVHF